MNSSRTITSNKINTKRFDNDCIKLEGSKDSALTTLKNDEELKNALREIKTIVNGKPTPEQVRLCAHAIMGVENHGLFGNQKNDFSSLPVGISKAGIKPETKKILAELFKTSIHGFFAEHESKTIHKIIKLCDLVGVSDDVTQQTAITPETKTTVKQLTESAEHHPRLSTEKIQRMLSKHMSKSPSEVSKSPTVSQASIPPIPAVVKSNPTNNRELPSSSGKQIDSLLSASYQQQQYEKVEADYDESGNLKLYKKNGDQYEFTQSQIKLTVENNEYSLKYNSSVQALEPSLDLINLYFGKVIPAECKLQKISKASITATSYASAYQKRSYELFNMFARNGKDLGKTLLELYGNKPVELTTDRFRNKYLNLKNFIISQLTILLKDIGISQPKDLHTCPPNELAQTLHFLLAEGCKAMSEAAAIQTLESDIYRSQYLPHWKKTPTGQYTIKGFASFSGIELKSLSEQSGAARFATLYPGSNTQNTVFLKIAKGSAVKKIDMEQWKTEKEILLDAGTIFNVVSEIEIEGYKVITVLPHYDK